MRESRSRQRCPAAADGDHRVRPKPPRPGLSAGVHRFPRHDAVVNHRVRRQRGSRGGNPHRPVRRHLRAAAPRRSHHLTEPPSRPCSLRREQAATSSGRLLVLGPLPITADLNCPTVAIALDSHGPAGIAAHHKESSEAGSPAATSPRCSEAGRDIVSLENLHAVRVDAAEGRFPARWRRATVVVPLCG